MKSIKKILVILFLITITFLACNFEQKASDEQTGQQNEVSEEFMEKRNELEKLASEEFSAINDRVRELNRSMEEREKQLSAEQKLLLDTIQEMRISVNNRLDEIENISEKEWETFETRFEKDLEKIQNKLDIVLEGF